MIDKWIEVFLSGLNPENIIEATECSCLRLVSYLRSCRFYRRGEVSIFGEKNEAYKYRNYKYAAAYICAIKCDG